MVETHIKTLKSNDVTISSISDQKILITDSNGKIVSSNKDVPNIYKSEVTDISGYLQSQITAVSGQVNNAVLLTGNQTISGNKTFVNNTTIGTADTNQIIQGSSVNIRYTADPLPPAGQTQFYLENSYIQMAAGLQKLVYIDDNNLNITHDDTINMTYDGSNGLTVNNLNGVSVNVPFKLTNINDGKILITDGSGQVISSGSDVPDIYRSEVSEMSGYLQGQIASTTINLTAGNIPQYDGTSLQNSLITQLDNKIGINTQPTGVQRVQVSGAIKSDLGSGDIPNDTFDTTVALRMCGADSGFVRLIGDTWNSNTVIGGRRANGTRNAPTTVSNGSALITIGGYGYNGTSFSTTTNAAYTMYASESWSGTTRSTYHAWFGTPDSSTTNSEWVRLQNGALAINWGTTVPAGSPKLNVNGDTRIIGITTIDNTDDTDAKIAMKLTRGTSPGINLYTYGDGSGNVDSIFFNSVEAFNILSMQRATGHIGINSPPTNSRMYIVGDVIATNNISTSGSLMIPIKDGKILITDSEGYIVSSGADVPDIYRSEVSEISGYLQNQINNISGGSSISGLTTGYLPVATSETTLSNSVIQQAASRIAIDSESATRPAPIVSSTLLHLAGADGSGQGIQADAWAGTGFTLYGRAASGTRSSPSATTGDRVLVNILGYGHDGTDYTTSPSIRYQQQADGLWSGSNRGTYHTWYGTPNGSTTAAEWMRLANGKLGVTMSPTGTASLQVNGAISVQPTGSVGLYLQKYDNSEGGEMVFVDNTKTWHVDAFNGSMRFMRHAANDGGYEATHLSLEADGGISMLQSDAGSFAGGVWSRDVNWGTYYRSPYRGSIADFAIADYDGDAVFRIRDFAISLYGQTSSYQTGTGAIPALALSHYGTGVGDGCSLLFNHTTSERTGRIYSYATSTNAGRLYIGSANPTSGYYDEMCLVGGKVGINMIPSATSAVQISGASSFYGGSAPGTPGATDVLIGAGKVITGDAIVSYRPTRFANITLRGQAALTAGVTDGFHAGIEMIPNYTGAYTVTRHNYMYLTNVATGLGSAVTDSCVFAFSAAIGTHKALASGTTKSSPGTVTGWIKINVAGTLHYLPLYNSMTS